MACCLADIDAEQKVKVLNLGATGSLFRRKLLSMGITPGIEIKVNRRAPMGGPLELSLRGFSLSLRKDEARDIRVEIIAASVS